MITREEARARVEQELSATHDGMTEDTRIILDDATLEKPWGWVFFYTSRRYHETGDFRYALAGNAPYLVERATGRLMDTGTAYPTADYIANYERTGDPHDASQ
ncbi:YrhB domain-containing protein [Pseudoxanthomonas sp. LjRoot143]|uniref:YrhB domain-containing protein n=1 Tax=Pseudoxanthomonas sp. LjRoot143 TaxID=3342266 RepID=UPI003ECD1287